MSRRCVLLLDCVCHESSLNIGQNLADEKASQRVSPALRTGTPFWTIFELLRPRLQQALDAAGPIGTLLHLLLNWKSPMLDGRVRAAHRVDLPFRLREHRSMRATYRRNIGGESVSQKE